MSELQSQTSQSAPGPSVKHRRFDLWSAIFLYAVLIVPIVVAFLVPAGYVGIGGFSIAVLPLLMIRIAVRDLLRSQSRRFSNYVIIVFSILVIGALVMAFVSRFG